MSDAASVTGDHEIKSFISFDVEALPGRAAANPLELLVWGELNGGKYGIQRLSKILGMHKLKGNFLVDFGMCLLYGDKAVKHIVQFLLEEGHEVHAHLHSEWVVRKWGIEGKWEGPLGLDRTDLPLTDALLQFTAWKYELLTGKAPSAFRSGAYLFSEKTIDAAKRNGFRLLTNYNSERHAVNWPPPQAAVHNQPFVWNNHLFELPVDFSPEPLSFDWSKYIGYYDRVRTRKTEKTFNLVLHSWSLLKRNGELFETYAPDHEDRLHQICEHLATHTQSRGYEEYLNWRESAPQPLAMVAASDCALVATERISPLTTCTICGYGFTKVPDADTCPGCGSRARHRQLKDVFTRIGNPFDGKTVLANYANTVEQRAFLRRTRTLLNFDVRPVSEVEMQMDVQDMKAIRDGAVDAFLAFHVLNHVRDDEQALREVSRVLKPGGMAWITVPYDEHAPTAAAANTVEHYGQDALEKYGVGTYRRYGLNDATSLFKKYFDVVTENGFDPVTREFMLVFSLRKPKMGSPRAPAA